jgi:hypothetical protein
MEAILDLYAEAPDPRRPVIGLDESPYALRAEVVAPLPAAPGRRRRVDYEYARCGTCSVAVAIDRHRGWRHVWVGDQRTASDFAGWVKELVDVHYPAAQTIRLVVDNLNTHTPAAFYTAFGPEEGRRLARKVEFHYTPKHGSWLNLVEIELSVLATHCLNRRLPTIASVQAAVAPWVQERNARRATINWRFTTDDARHKLGNRYRA